MTFAIQGSYGNQIFNALKRFTYNNNGSSNWNVERLNSYRLPVKDASGNIIDAGNTNTGLFRVDAGNSNNNLRQSDWYVEDGSYVRLKSLQFGYTLPETLTNKYGVAKLRVYVGANNLLTITNYSGMDPEVGAMSRLVTGIDLGVYPQARMFLAGINVSF